MRKFITLLLALCIGSAIGQASTYRATVNDSKKVNTNYPTGLELSENTASMSVTLYKDAAPRKKADSEGRIDLPSPNGRDRDQAKNFGIESMNMRIVEGDNKAGSLLNLTVNKKLQNVYIYYSADGNNLSSRMITLEDASGFPVSLRFSEDLQVYQENNSDPAKSEYSYLAIVDRLPVGEYKLYSSGFTGGLIGIGWDVLPDEDKPTANESRALESVSGNKTWDFSDVSATSSYYNYYRSNNSDYQTYAYFYSQNSGISYYGATLKYNKDFDGKTIAFKGTYPIYNESGGYGYAQDGTLEINPTKPGGVRVTFTDIGDTRSTNAYRRYLAINGQRTDYWTSIEKTGDGAYGEQLNVTSGIIPVEAGLVEIRGLQEDGKTNAPIRVSKVEYIAFGDNGANSIINITDDTFSQRVYSRDAAGRSVSTWTYCGYKHTTHGLRGGVDDNGILYVSSDHKGDDTADDDDNTNGNITFYAPDSNAPYYWLSCSYGSTVYVPVASSNSSGTITITCTQNDYTNGTTAGERYFELQKEGSDGVINKLGLLKTASINFSRDDISTVVINGKTKYCLKLVAHFDEDYTSPNQYLYKGEMKVLSISVALKDETYELDEPEMDYDHSIGKDHTHAIFNWTQGEAWNEGNYHGTLTMRNGAVLEGTDPLGPSTGSNTPTIYTYRNGDIIKYKTNYYGGLQFLSDVKYTVKAPDGYYITTSVRLHGHNNQNESKTDDDTSLFTDTYVSTFNEGKFDGRDDTYVKFPRDDKNARTTTLDFTVPASESIDFTVKGYQIFGLVDAVLVPRDAVPQIDSKVYYKAPGATEAIALKPGDSNDMLVGGGTIYCASLNDDEELWWYFHSTKDPADSRGIWDYINSHPDVDVDGVGEKDQNVTKHFSVRNYKFVKATGRRTTDDLKTTNEGGSIYDDRENYYFSLDDEAATASYVMPLALTDGEYTQYPFTLDLNEDGAFYFYVRNTSNNYNSVLSVSGFDSTVGVEAVEVDNLLQAAGRDGFIYNIYGQRVDESYRGVVIKDGRKYMQK
ncbi:MAG: hypothetical protein J1E84_07005 [Muribaculaceae bacterium]|nr:hypothetical protein [Muribaculaceae bacterium]